MSNTKKPLHDWVCDVCGRKVYARRKVPRRCHMYPMRPMGSPWKFADELHAKLARSGAATILSLPDDYWVSPPLLKRLQALVDGSPKIRWESSCRRKGGTLLTATYNELRETS